MPLVDPKIWFTLTEAAAFLSVSKGRISRLIRDKRLTTERAGRTVYVRIADAVAYRDSPRKPGRPPTKSAPAKKRKR